MSLQQPEPAPLNQAQDPNELFDVVRADGTPTGERKSRALVHRDGDWHRALHVWVAGIDDGSPFILIQRRSNEKDTGAGWLDVTVGGHYGAGEGLPQVLREVEEEIGVSPAVDDLRFLGRRVAVGEHQVGVVDREIQDVFLWNTNAPLTAYSPNPHELNSLIKSPLEPLLDVFAGDLESVRVETLNAFDRGLAESELREDDFVVRVDRYIYRAAIAVSRSLRGERHVLI